MTTMLMRNMKEAADIMLGELSNQKLRGVGGAFTWLGLIELASVSQDHVTVYLYLKVS